MCFSLEEFAQKSTTKPVSSNWLLVNNRPKKVEPVVIEKKEELVRIDVPKSKVETIEKAVNLNIKFYAERDSLMLGESTFIHWDIPSEVRVTLSQSIDGEKFEINSTAFANKGKDNISPETTTFYKIKSDKIEKVIKVNIITVKKPSIEYFYFEKKEINLGESTKLKWSVLNINNVTLETSINEINWSIEENAIYSNIGEKIISPKKDVYYRLVAKDATVKRKLTVIK